MTDPRRHQLSDAYDRDIARRPELTHDIIVALDDLPRSQRLGALLTCFYVNQLRDALKLAQAMRQERDHEPRSG